MRPPSVTMTTASRRNCPRNKDEISEIAKNGIDEANQYISEEHANTPQKKRKKAQLVLGPLTLERLNVPLPRLKPNKNLTMHSTSNS